MKLQLDNGTLQDNKLTKQQVGEEAGRRNDRAPRTSNKIS